MCLTFAQAQEGMLLWQETFGGDGIDRVDAMCSLDGDTYLVGSNQSNDGNMDVFVVRMNAYGEEVWRKDIIGEKDDRGVAIELNLNQELVVLCSSNSTNEWFSGNKGGTDIYVFTFTTDGKFIESNSFGGSDDDIATDMSVDAENNILISSYSRSSDGEMPDNQGLTDGWVVKLNQSLLIEWVQNVSGVDEDYLTGIQCLSNDEIAVVGHSTSFGADFEVNYGDFDISVFRLSPEGSILQTQNFGGFQAEMARDIATDFEGNIIILGSTVSNSIDVQNNHGFSDAWILSLNAYDLSMNWSMTHGDEGSEYAVGLAISNGGDILVTGTTNSAIFRGSQLNGHQDLWVARFSGEGDLKKHQLIGNGGFDKANDLYEDEQGNLIICGETTSSEGYIQDHQGRTDGWIFKISDKKNLGPGLNIVAHPNPVRNNLYLNNMETGDRYVITNSLGQVVISEKEVNNSTEIVNFSGLLSGHYIVKLMRDTEVQILRIICN